MVEGTGTGAEARVRAGMPSAEAWRAGGIMTGERELPGRVKSGARGGEEQASAGTE